MQETVPTISLEDLLDKAACTEVDFLKCDVEGAEFEIFLSTPVPIIRRIRRLVMEVHLTIDQAESKEKALIERLREAGLAVRLHTPPGPLLSRILTAQRA